MIRALRALTRRLLIAEYIFNLPCHFTINHFNFRNAKTHCSGEPVSSVCRSQPNSVLLGNEDFFYANRLQWFA